MNTILKKLTETLEARKKDDPTKSYAASLYHEKQSTHQFQIFFCLVLSRQ